MQILECKNCGAKTKVGVKDITKLSCNCGGYKETPLIVTEDFISNVREVVECLVLESMHRPSFTFGRIEKLADELYKIESRED